LRILGGGYLPGKEVDDSFDVGRNNTGSRFFGGAIGDSGVTCI